jgi:hypothetical protein
MSLGVVDKCGGAGGIRCISARVDAAGVVLAGAAAFAVIGVDVQAVAERDAAGISGACRNVVGCIRGHGAASGHILTQGSRERNLRTRAAKVTARPSMLRVKMRRSKVEG